MHQPDFDHQSRRAGGFSMLEALIAVAITLVAATAGWRMLENMHRSEQSEKARSEAQTDLRLLQRDIVRESERRNVFAYPNQGLNITACAAGGCQRLDMLRTSNNHVMTFMTQCVARTALGLAASDVIPYASCMAGAPCGATMAPVIVMLDNGVVTRQIPALSGGSGQRAMAAYVCSNVAAGGAVQALQVNLNVIVSPTQAGAANVTRIGVRYSAETNVDLFSAASRAGDEVLISH